MKNTATLKSVGGFTTTISIDMDTDGTHKAVREGVEAVFAEAVETIKRRAIQKAPDAKFWIENSKTKPRLKDSIDTFRKARKGKNITSKTDKFGVVAGKGDYPDAPKKHPREALAKAAHIELGTSKTPPRPFMYPAYDETRAEMLASLEGII